MDSSSGEIQKRLQGLDLSQELHGEAKTPLADLLHLRTKGNQWFQRGDWKGAIACYSECIDFALKNKEEVCSKDAIDVFVSCYSNRAEACLKLEEYGKAVEDCEKALELDSTHLKSLFRKGRALNGLREYNLACSCFRLALDQSPHAKEIKSHYDKSKKLNEENQQGKFDLSAYFLNGFRQQYIPEVGNYIGPVIIKKSPVHGRGLFATKNVKMGDTLLVENAIAVSGIYCRSMAFRMEENPPSKLEGLHQDTVERAAACAMSCPRILWQLTHLTESIWREETEVPDIELFKVNNGSWNKVFGENPVNFQINAFDLRKATELNCLVTYISTYEENPVEGSAVNGYSSIGLETETNVIEQCGLWVLPSFINHSCFPNAKCIVIGKAMFIIAVRGIAAEEEITVSYIRSLYPLAERERDLTPLGFRCECKRCVLERSLGPSFQELSQKIHNYCRSLLDTYISPRDMRSLLGFALQLEKIDDQDEQKLLIRSSFYCLYKYFFAAAEVYTGFGVQSPSLPSMVDVAEALWHAEPGSGYSLKMFKMLLQKAHGRQKDLLFRKAMENSKAIIGKHKEHVLKDFVVSKFDGCFQFVRPWNAREVHSVLYARRSKLVR